MRPVHRWPTLDEIFSNLNNAKYLSPTDVSSGYHNLKLDKRLMIPHNICMPIWQVQIQEIAVWGSPHKGYVPKKNKWNT